MNQDNWEKAKSEKAKEFEKKYLDGTNESHWAACLDGFDAGADFGRAYSQGEIDRLTKESYAIASNANRLNDQVNQLAKENTELQAKYDELVSYLPKIPTEPYLLELQAKYEKALEVLKFYSNDNNWCSPPEEEGIDCVIKHYDIEETEDYYSGEKLSVGGKLARQVLKELNETNNQTKENV